MKKFNFFVKTFEYSMYIALSCFLIKTVLSLAMGFFYFPVEYAGPSFYYWRHQYVDKEIAKSTYSYIKPNTEDAEEPFISYSNYVQGSYDISKLQSDISIEKEKLISKNSENVEAEISKFEKGKKDLAAFNKLGLSSLYIPEKFTDSFVYGPKKSFKIFRNGKESPFKLLDHELNFLAFRHVFLSYLSSVSGKDSFVAIKDSDVIDNFFTNKDTVQVENLTVDDHLKFLEDEKPKVFEKVDQSLLKETNEIAKVTVRDSENNKDLTFYLTKSQADAVLNYIKVYPEFKKLVKSIQESQLVQIENGEIKFLDSAIDTLYSIFSTLGLAYLENEKVSESGNFLFENKESFTKAANGFLYRIAAIRPDAMDSHILNRFYYYYLFVNSDLDLSKFDISNDLPVKEHLDIIEELSKKGDSNSQAKLKNFNKKVAKERVELIFNKLSQDIANALGNKSYLLNPKDDTRMFPFKYFAYPATYKDSDKSKVTSPFAESTA